MATCRITMGCMCLKETCRAPPRACRGLHICSTRCVSERLPLLAHLGPLSTLLSLPLPRVRTRGRPCTSWGPGTKVSPTLEPHTGQRSFPAHGHCLSPCQVTIGGHRITTWAPLTGRALGAWSRAQALTGPTTSKTSTAHRTLMGGKSSTADPRRAGDLGKGTRAGGWGDTGGVATEGWGATEGTGVLKTDTAAQTSEDAETTGEPRW